MTQYVKIIKNDALSHVGVLGMHWGHTKKGYRSTNIRSALARRSNDVTDAGFKDWKENDQKKQHAISTGKTKNEAQRNYASNPKDKQAKSDYKSANKDYKSALKANTTYRKGVVKQEVGSDMARKYLSDAKKLKKSIDAGTADSKTKQQYQHLMNKYDVERASARRAVAVASKRSQKKASMKRAMTMTVKAAAATAAITAGGAYVNNKLASQGKQTINIQAVVDFAKKAKDFAGYF